MRTVREVVAWAFALCAILGMIATFISLIGLVRMHGLQGYTSPGYGETVHTVEEPRYTQEVWEQISQDPILQGKAPTGGGR